MLGIPSFISVALMIFGAGIVGSLIARRLRFLPITAWLICSGTLLAVIVEYFGLDTGIRASNLQPLIFYGFLPVLIFEAAYIMPKQVLRQYLPTILLLATIGLFISIIVGGGLLWLGMSGTSFTLSAALLVAIMLSATDPLAVISQVKDLGAPQKLGVLLEGESLFNDATVIVLFTLVSAMILNPVAENMPYGLVFVQMLQVFFGGLFVGILFGALTEFVRVQLGAIVPVGLLSLSAAYGSFYVAEHWFHFSGVMAVLATGILMSLRHDREGNKHLIMELKIFWENLAYIFNTAVFVIMGLVITVGMFTQRWQAMLIAIVALLIARTISVYVGLWLAGKSWRQQEIPFSYKAVMTWGGLRGVIAIALVLGLSSAKIEHWFTIQSMVFGVVLFSILVQAPTVPILMRRFKII